MRITESKLRSIIRSEIIKNDKRLNESMLGSIKDYFTGSKSFKTAEDVLAHAEVFSDVDSNVGDTFEPYEVELYNAKKAMSDKLLELKGAGLRVKDKVVKKILNAGTSGADLPSSLRIMSIEDLAVDNMRHPSQFVNKQQNDRSYSKTNPDYVRGARIHYKASIFAIMGDNTTVQFILEPFNYELLGENKSVVGKGSITSGKYNSIIMNALLACPTEDLFKVDKELAKRVDLLIDLENEDKHNKWLSSINKNTTGSNQKYQDQENDNNVFFIKNKDGKKVKYF